MPKLLIATQNKGKVEEIQSLLDHLEIELITPNQMGIEMEVVETGDTSSPPPLSHGCFHALEDICPVLGVRSGQRTKGADLQRFGRGKTAETNDKYQAQQENP